MAAEPAKGRTGRRSRGIPTVSAVLANGAIVEMVYRPLERRSAFAIWDADRWRLEPVLDDGSGRRLVPYSSQNNLLRNEVVLLPSEPLEYGTESDLVSEIRAFIHRHVDVSPLFETIASYYVLMSWIYEDFTELPYLRVRGDPGSGKTRLLLTVGAICYKPIFASGASTVSPIFRILDAVRGTLIIDEGDFRASDERAEIVKILNNGNAKGFPVLRSEPTRQGEFNPRAYAVFGPKLVATRGFFEDRALESRCLTEEMGHGRLREDIPISLAADHKDEALVLRNKLLLFRFRHLHRYRAVEQQVDRTIEPRLSQIFLPLQSIVEDPSAQAALRALAQQYHREMIADRGLDTEAQVLEVIRDMLASDPGKLLAVKDVTSWFSDRHGTEFQRPVTAKWIGGVLRRRLGLKTYKSHGVFVIAPEEMPKLERLYERYGVSPAEAPAAEDDRSAA
jgi:hypothetical protein